MLTGTAEHARPQSAGPPAADAAALGLSSAIAATSLAAALAAARSGAAAAGPLLPEFLFGAAFAAGLGASGMARPSKVESPRGFRLFPPRNNTRLSLGHPARDDQAVLPTPQERCPPPPKHEGWWWWGG